MYRLLCSVLERFARAVANEVLGSFVGLEFEPKHLAIAVALELVIGEAVRVVIWVWRRLQRRRQADTVIWADAGGGALLLVSPGTGAMMPWAMRSGVDKDASGDKNVNPRL
jgi:hypothetical protein